MAILVLAADAIDATNSGYLRYLPLAVMAALFFWLLAVVVRAAKRAKPLHDRSLRHMDRLESQADEAIALLREIRDKLNADG